MQIDIEKLLNGPSNLEEYLLSHYNSGGVKIKVELYNKDGLIFKSFDLIIIVLIFYVYL